MPPQASRLVEHLIRALTGYVAAFTSVLAAAGAEIVETMAPYGRRTRPGMVKAVRIRDVGLSMLSAWVAPSGDWLNEYADAACLGQCQLCGAQRGGRGDRQIQIGIRSVGFAAGRPVSRCRPAGRFRVARRRPLPRLERPFEVRRNTKY